MEIVCESCRANLSLPDEKLPRGQRVGVRCPRCKSKIIIDTPSLDLAGVGSENGLPETSASGWAKDRYPEATGASDLWRGVDGFEGVDVTPLDVYEEGDKLGLVLVSDSARSNRLRDVLEELGYTAIQVETTREAISRIRLQSVDMVVISDGFDNIPLAQSPILQYLNHLSMSVRRTLFIVLISDTFRTMDHMMAFAMSANLVANWKDLDRLSKILRRAASDHDHFYKVFMDTLRETGKA